MWLYWYSDIPNACFANWSPKQRSLNFVASIQNDAWISGWSYRTGSCRTIHHPARGIVSTVDIFQYQVQRKTFKYTLCDRLLSHYFTRFSMFPIRRTPSNDLLQDSNATSECYSSSDPMTSSDCLFPWEIRESTGSSPVSRVDPQYHPRNGGQVTVHITPVFLYCKL